MLVYRCYAKINLTQTEPRPTAGAPLVAVAVGGGIAVVALVATVLRRVAPPDTPALRHLLAAGPPFASRLVVMVQAEVAERIAARPGDMSSLAVTIQAQARVRIVRRVPARAFYPKPKVDSAVLLVEPRA